MQERAETDQDQREDRGVDHQPSLDVGLRVELAYPLRQATGATPEDAWEAVQAGRARLLDLRTAMQRRRYGWPPGAPRVSLARHIANPEGADAIYLCQHANRSKLTARRGAAEVQGGWPAWEAAGLPLERD